VKVGDLVKPSKDHGLRNEIFRSHGIVLEHHKKNKHWNEYVVVCWNDGDVEPEKPFGLEVLNKC